MTAAPAGLRRTWLRLLLVALAALAAAVAATLAVERARPALFRAPDGPLPPLPIPRTDVHQELTPGVVDYAGKLSGLFGIRRVVNLTGGWLGDGLESQLGAAARHGGRVRLFVNPDPSGCCGAAWLERELARMAWGKGQGALGLALLGRDGAPLPEALLAADGLLDGCERLGLPVALRLGHPGAGALLERRPGLRVLALGADGRGPEELRALLDRHPGLHLALSGTVPALAARGEAARALLLAHPDRFLFATGARYQDRPPFHELWLGGDAPAEDEDDLRRFFLGLYRLLESRDPAIPLPEKGAEGTRPGLGLPRDLLERLYHRNAERLLGLPSEEAR